ncbi:MAG: hypothetical protein GY930_01785 [bacterium]|nr:hypothetical protein [bacterium]
MENSLALMGRTFPPRYLTTALFIARVWNQRLVAVVDAEQRQQRGQAAESWKLTQQTEYILMPNGEDKSV